MIIPKEIDYLLKLQKRKDAERRILKVYEALLFKRGNKKNYFDCPSSYLKSISGQYSKVIKLLIDYGIIEYYSKNESENWNDIFDHMTIKKKKYYNTEAGHSIKYRFLIDTTKGREITNTINTDKLYEDKNWFSKTKYSLLQLGFKPEEILIKRDNFSRRLHTNITGNISEHKSYRNLMSNDRYYVIDSKTSQPRLLWLKLNEIGLHDERLDYIFTNELDFYDYLLQKMPILNNDRQEAKELFASWVNGTGYLEEEKVAIRNIFPVANFFIKNFKSTSYKDVCRYLQYTEATIFIDDLLENIPVEFCLTVHDSLLVRAEDADSALEWCESRRPELRFEKMKIEKKHI